MSFFKKLKAMTYSELAIVLTIIGVIAALTVPSLKRYSQRSEYEKRAQKAYVTLEEAIDNAVMEHGIMKYWGKIGVNNIFPTYIVPYLSTMTNVSASSITTKDGINYTLVSCTATGEVIKACKIQIDTNGLRKEPNIEGKDRFIYEMNFEEEKLIPLDDADTLFKNGWKFTDELWNK